MFDSALKLVLELEGGYVNDPDDPGGKTNLGITQEVYDPTFKKDVRFITVDEAGKIYERDYWKAGSCDIIDLFNPRLALVHFDDCVNCGISRANKTLQASAGVVKDGILGPLSFHAIKSNPGIISSYLDQRKIWYDTLILEKPKLVKFKSSWYHRLNVIASRIGLPWTTKVQ